MFFLTGLNWANPFITDFESLPMLTNNQYVEYVGKYENSLIIVAQHPQGKQEKSHVSEIIANYNLNKK